MPHSVHSARSQYETFDPKPDAPAEIRDIFEPTATNAPRVRICELLPRTARIADELRIVRSVSTGDPIRTVLG